MVEESKPPLDQTPRGTSETICSRTGVAEERIELFFRIGQGDALVGVEVEFPVGLLVDASAPPFHPLAGRQLLDTFHHGVRTGNVVEREIVMQARAADVTVEFGVQQDGLHLGAEVEVATAMRDVERLDAHAVADEHQAALRLGPEGGGEHAAQARERVGVPFEEGSQDGFGIAGRVETVAALDQLAAKLGVVVDLAVEDQDGVAVIAAHGLLAVLQVDDFEANSAEGHIRGFPDVLFVGTAVGQRACNLPDPVRIGKAVFMSEPSNSTQVARIPQPVPRLPLRIRRALPFGLL